MRLISIMICATVLSACESSSAVMSASEKGLGALTCPEIQNTFAAFERDRYSVEAAKQLGLNFNLPYEAGTSLSNYYDMAKTAANVALLAQGCGAIGQ